MTRNELLEKAKEYISLETDPQFRGEIEQLLAAENYDELNDRFYTEIEFGTGGLRGVIGGGYNRMNPFTVQQATEGLARYVDRSAASDATPSAVIAHDSRRYSDTFALQAALVLAAHGIRTYLFSSLRPTPELSFAVRYLGACTGIVVTASHNPKEYNGYKVYWDDGAQVVEPHDNAIIEEVRAVGGSIKRISREDAIDQGTLVMIDREIDDAYVESVKRVSIRPELLHKHAQDLEIVYTPLHGAGGYLIERVLGELGLQVVPVPEQRDPDSEFPTVTFPNPEEPAALDLALKLGAERGAQIVMGTDPDADRIGIAIPDDDQRFQLITGNQLGVLLVDYVFSSRAELGTLPKRPAFIKTIVTTNLQRRVAEYYGAECYDTLTGFKHIAALIRDFESRTDGPQFIMGDEESYGYLIGTEVRDKDAVAAALLCAEMTAYHYSQGRSILDRLHQIYRTFGYFEESTLSRYFEGQQGRETMDGLMRKLRANSPRSFGGLSVVEVRDYQAGSTTDLRSGETRSDIDLPRSNVLQFILEDETIISARPSGTEPKIKFYTSCAGAPGEELAEARPAVAAKVAAIRDEIESFIDTETS